MIKSKNFIIPLVIYPFEVMVSMGETLEQLSKKVSCYGFTKEEIQDCEYGNEFQQGRCLMINNNLIIRMKYIPKSNGQYAMLQHEIFHCVQFVMDYLKVPLSMETCEPYAYLIQYLTKEIYNKI